MVSIPRAIPADSLSVPMVARVVSAILDDPARVAAVLIRIAMDQPDDAAQRIDVLVSSLLEQAA